MPTVSIYLILAKMQSLIDRKHMFDPVIFKTPSIITHLNVDDLAITKQKEMIPLHSSILNDEIKERFHLWHECLAVDTFTSMATGKAFRLDETLYPMEFSHSALRFMYQDMIFQVPVDYARLCLPLLARNTMWEASEMSSTFDDLREMSCLAALHFSNGLLRYRVQLLRSVRRSIRFARENVIGAEHRFVGDSILLIHNSLITQFESVPLLFLPFSSLLLFRPYADNSMLVINNVCRSFSAFSHDLLLLFAGFTYIHLPNVGQITQLFPLSSKSKTVFSSAEILLAILKAVAFIVRSLYTPIIGPELHRQSPIIIENISNSMNGSIIPAPGLATIESALALYIISSCGALTAKRNTALAEEIYQLLHKCYIPALQKIGNVKPAAKEYVQKLKNLI